MVPCAHPGGPSVAFEYGAVKAAIQFKLSEPLRPELPLGLRRQLQPPSQAHAGMGLRRQVEPSGTTPSKTSTAGMVKSGAEASA